MKNKKCVLHSIISVLTLKKNNIRSILHNQNSFKEMQAGFLNILLCQSEKSLTSDILVLGSYLAAIYIGAKLFYQLSMGGSHFILGPYAGQAGTITNDIAVSGMAIGVMYAAHILIRQHVSSCDGSGNQLPNKPNLL